MPSCTVKLRDGKTCTFPGATGEEDGFSVIVYGAENAVLGRFGLPDVSSWWNDEDNPPEEAERVNPDPDPFA